MKKLLIAICLLAHFTHAQSIRKVRIGNQTWMSKNLDTDLFRNGDPIPEARTDEEWRRADENKQPAWCYYNNDPAYGKIYGKLYNWYAVSDSRVLAPKGWHIPNSAELDTLTGFLGEGAVAGRKLKSKKGWNTGQNGDNKSRFSALPGGNCDFTGRFGLAGETGGWWSCTETDTAEALSLFLIGVLDGTGRIVEGKGSGNSVRCIKD